MVLSQLLVRLNKLGKDDECTDTRERVPWSELEEQRLLAAQEN